MSSYRVGYDWQIYMLSWQILTEITIDNKDNDQIKIFKLKIDDWNFFLLKYNIWKREVYIGLDNHHLADKSPGAKRQ